jgi:hypothetical protein
MQPGPIPTLGELQRATQKAAPSVYRDSNSGPFLSDWRGSGAFIPPNVAGIGAN